jgi:acetyl esterase/lipase
MLAPLGPDEPPVRLIDRRSSLRSRGLTRLLRWLANTPLRHDDDIAALRRRYEAIDARHVSVARTVRREPVQCNGVAAEWISVPETVPGRTLLLMHGGSFAFRFPNLYAAFAARLCRRLGARALIPDYRLAPEHPYPAAPDDCQATWRWLLERGCDPRQVVLLGDSAGGNLALVTLYRSVKAGEPLPACAVLLSPGVDCTLDSHSMVENEGRDPVIRLPNLLVLRRHYVPSSRLYTDPDVSPLFADFSGFPPLLLQAGHSEMLRDEAIRTAKKAHAAGVDVELELWRDTMHGFQVAPFLPEAALAVDQMVQFVSARTGWQATGASPLLAGPAVAGVLP